MIYIKIMKIIILVQTLPHRLELTADGTIQYFIANPHDQSTQDGWIDPEGHSCLVSDPGEYILFNRFFLFGSLQNCVSCHIRLPAAQRFPFAQELMAKDQVEALAPREQAWLLVTLRQFDDALAIWEGMIEDSAIPASELDATGVMEDYMNVAIRVRLSTQRHNGECLEARCPVRSGCPETLGRPPPARPAGA